MSETVGITKDIEITVLCDCGKELEVAIEMDSFCDLKIYATPCNCGETPDGE